MKRLLTCAFAVIFSTSVQAQSLKPESPTAMQPGINKGTVDNMVGTHYWFFTGGPGKTHVYAKFKSFGLLGNPYRATVTVTLSDAANTWHAAKAMMSEGPAVDYTFEGDIKAPTKVIVSVAPPANGLVRTGGDYELTATGAVAFGKVSDVDPVIGTYKQMAGYTSLLGTCKFLPNGSIETTSGAGGNWKLFDKATQSYVINIDGQERQSFQYSPGRGLVDGGIIIFQELK